MRIGKKILLFLLTYTTVNCSIAQNIKNNHPEDHYRAIHWTIDNGLTEPDVSFMTKDIKGFLWMGTRNGLNKFDGNTFKYYFSDKNQKTSIGNDNSSFGLLEDSLHNIWIGTVNGISRYDIRSDTFTNFSSPQPIIPFWAEKNEILCWDFYDAQAIVSYNIHSFVRKLITKVTSADSLGGGNIKFNYSIFDAAEQSIWMLPEDKTQGGLLQISLIEGKRKFYPWPVYKERKVDHAGAEAMRYDRKRNCIWINSPVGLIYFTLNDKQFHHIDALDKFTNIEGYDRFVGIDIDPKGRIWFATKPKGIIIYNPADQSVDLPFPNDSSIQADASIFNACVYCDRDGIVWTGSWLKTGIYQLVPFSRVVTHYFSKPNVDHGLIDNSVRSFAEGDKGTIWINTRFGMNIFDPASGKFDTLNNLSQFKGNDGENDIRPIFIDTVSRKALLEYQGIYEMDLDSKELRPVILIDSAGNVIRRSENEGSFSHKFKNGCITAAYHNHRLGVFLITTDSAVGRELISFRADEVSPGYIGFEDPSPAFIVTDDSLLFIPLLPDKKKHLTYAFAGNKLTGIHTSLDSIRWNEIIYSKADQTYWVSSDRELMHYSKDFRIIHTYTPEEGLPPFDFSCLTLDNNNNLWFHTDRSIHQINTKTGEFSQLSEKDGLEKIDFYNYPGSLKASNGDIYFPTGNIGEGFIRISPAKFVSPFSTVYIEAIEVNQKPVSLATTANYLEQLTLRYFENKINISTGILDYYSKGKSRMRYKLEGQDTNWQYSSYYTTIRYEGLATGRKYRLLIQASNASNEFNGPVKSLFIYIIPAFWETWWFRILALVTLGLLFYAIIRRRLQQKFRLQLERSEKETQIAEMKSKATELEMQALRAQMNPHFIFNSLNSINRFILQNNRTQASEYLTKFSKLVRMILQNSQASLISLESELESLGLYLEMEALRFNYHFDYKISVPKDLDIEVLKVPPLILQPYVENAIWHGLMHKEEKGQLDIEISQDGDHLYFKVTDNGIGRKRAAELASKSATKHKSMGLRITAHRIAMMQNSNGLESPVKINDLVVPDGTAAGTEVIIKMPVLYD